MKKIKVKTPAKINLILEILCKRPDGFHEIRSIMQAVSLFDYLTITARDSDAMVISLDGNSGLIPYDRENIAFKAAEAFFKKVNIENQLINIYIEKNIPVAAGLAGGSSNAAGTLWGLNKLFGNPLSAGELHSIASILGSDVNFCLQGGTCIATSRGEVLQHLSTPDLKIVIARPKNLFISAKEAYQKYSKLAEKPETKYFERMKKAINNNSRDEISSLLNNDLEMAIFPAYPEIAQLKNVLLNLNCKNALMSGSGPSVFGIYTDNIDICPLAEVNEVFMSESINCGVTEKTYKV